MKCYSDYSFEELRLFSFLEKKNSEVIRAVDCGDLRYNGTWTPSATGNYCLSLIIDDIVAEEVYKIEVIDWGAPPPLQKTTLKKVQPQNRLRKFMAKNSAGLRIRLHPTLQSEQVGMLKVNGIISFTDELENDDGMWLRLTTESIREHCSPNWFPSEAWCLQYNQHLDKTLLFPIIEADPLNIFETSNTDQGFAEVLNEPDLQLGPVVSAKSQSTYNDAKDSVVTEEKLLPVEFKDQSCDPKQWQTHQKKGSQSNISATIAGVVGEGAIKLQALQKWFKGDRGEGHEGMRQDYRRSESDAGIETGVQLLRNERSQSLFDEFKDETDPGQNGSPFKSNKSKLDKQAEDFARAFLKVTADLKEQQATDEPTMNNKDFGAGKILKRALSPSIAETLRTVFAAFLWHEGLIHDAMACASFLKFHPNISKDFSVLENIAETEVLTREQKAQQRHSLEIASAEAYLNMRPATLEALTKSGNCCVHNRKRRSVRTTIDETGTGIGLREKLTREILPPALKGLVYMWDQLCCNFIQLAETSTTDGKEKVKMKGSAEEKRSENNRTYQRNKKDDGSWCELCDIFLPIPVTYHMRIVHPGCGKSSNGKGYNSIGVYCEGWAGNCGEGGQGASSWYLMCENCREKYSLNGKKNLDFNHMSSNSLQLSYNSTLIRSELFQIMKENSLFLLELNTANKNFPNRSKSRSSGMFTIKEKSYHQHEAGDDYLDYISDASFDNVSVKAAKMAVTATFDSIWCPPDSLSCLETLGGKYGSDLPYHFFDINGLGDVEYDRTVFNDIHSDQFEQNLHMTQNKIPTTSKFHRSFSVEQGWLSQTTTIQNICRKPGEINEDDLHPGVVMRRKKNCTCGKNACDSVLLRHPSVNLKRLVPENVLSSNGSASIKLIQTSDHQNIDDSVNEDDLLAANSLLLRPSMLFILEVHDLKKLKCLMKKKVQKTIGSIYSLQALNWIIRSVTQTISLHDLMWWFVTALKSGTFHNNEGNHTHFSEDEQALEHPVSSNQIGGNICEVQSQSLHNLLQTIAELTLMLPSGSAIQKISIQCFGLKFKQSDHQFLHRCHVFANISKILSKSEEQNEENSMASVNFLASGLIQTEQSSVQLANLQDITDIFEITVSSRPAMVNSLIDNSTETFWESDEEDRNKPKLIEASQIKSNYVCKVVSVFIDNSRDISTRVSSMFVYGGQSLREMNFITTLDVDAVECAWIPIRIEDDSLTHFRLEFRGSENTLRVRQIKLLGYDIKGNKNPIDPKATSASYIQQLNCEIETLRVFRLLTSQVFGKLIVKSPGNGNLLATPRSRELSTIISPSAESLDLREHMVGILFSRSKLTHLQRQIIVHIVHAIQKETQRIREEWEAKVIIAAPTSESPEHEKTDSCESDNYIFELLSMVLALSGSGVGKSYLSHQHGLLRDLLTLLHTGSDRIQRQVTALFRRILSEITPEGFGLILGISKVPQTDYGIINENSEDFDMHKLGIIDIFLSVIAKSLQIQLKTQTKAHSKTKVITTVKLNHYNLLDGTEYRSKHSVDTNTKSKDTLTSQETEILNPRMVATMYSDLYQSSSSCQESFPDQYDQVDEKSRDDLAQIELKRIEEVNNFTNRWFMKGTIANKQAENMIHFFKDMINGKFGERWNLVAKAAIAECIINLTRLDENFRLPENCIKTPTIWLALASLCVLDKDHVKRLSSSQWSKTLETRPMCTNHDDGITPAIIECGTCGSLCGDCDRFLHLNRRTRSHYRTLCKEEEEAISVELHENCGRTKLFWLLALADSKTLKGMVEFRDGHSNILGNTSDTVGRCRFCGTTGNTGLLAVGNVCAEQQCQEYAAEACNKILSCGHFCNGIANEEKCLCLHSKCQRSSLTSAKQNEPKLTQDGDDMCMICFTEALSAQPSIQLNCGHVFHYRCCKQVLVKRWHGARITFGFAQCGICKSDIAHDALNDILEPIMTLKNDVKRKALMRLHYEGIKDTSSKDMAQFAMDKYAYYMCSQCDKAYYGGEVRCDQELGEKYDPKELVCGGCSDVSRAQICPKHGTDYLEYKCRYCCSVAIFFCFGTTHFCDVCHDDFQKLTNIPKNKLPQCPVGPKAKKLQGDECPLHIVHPPTGEEFALGCGICRNAQNF
uniref:RCR-type E3 ubiquitin transferase n=1 Tax=Culicoides sonorensis TaxID=179676 RepID=A0A336LRN5_CULSO